jgi:hypothetical protein
LNSGLVYADLQANIGIRHFSLHCAAPTCQYDWFLFQVKVKYFMEAMFVKCKSEKVQKYFLNNFGLSLRAPSFLSRGEHAYCFIFYPATLPGMTPFENGETCKFDHKSRRSPEVGNQNAFLLMLGAIIEVLSESPYGVQIFVFVIVVPGYIGVSETYIDSDSCLVVKVM